MVTYDVSVIDSLDQLEGLRTEWNNLLSSSRSDTVFLTWEWVSSWVEYFMDAKRNPFILTVRDGDRLIAVAPWYMSHKTVLGCRLKQIESIGTPETGSDYLDIICLRGKERGVADCIFDHLFRHDPSRWDSLMLREIPANSLFLQHFISRTLREGKHSDIIYGSFCPSVILPKSDKDLFAGLSSRRVQRFRQELRALHKGAEIDHVTASAEASPGCVDDFFLLYEEKTGWESKNLRLFLKTFVRRSREGVPKVQVDILKANGNQVGGLLHLNYHGFRYMYLMAIDKAYNPKISLGNVFVGLCLQRAIMDGVEVYDFLKGSEDYKFHWSNNYRTSFQFYLPQRKIMPILATMAKCTRMIGKVALR